MEIYQFSMKDILLAILSSFKKMTSKSRFPNIENIHFVSFLGNYSFLHNTNIDIYDAFM